MHYDRIEIGAIPLYSPDGRWLVVASGNKIHLQSVARRFSPGKGRSGASRASAFQTLAFSPDSNRLLSGGMDQTVRLWDVNARQLIAEWDWKIGDVNRVAFAPDGMTAAAAGSNGLVVVWDLDV